MITIPEAFTGLYAAWRLFLRDARAITLFDATPAGAIKSFWCALIVLPGYALIILLIHTRTAGDVDGFRFVLVEGIAYVVSWCAWPLLMFHVTRALDRSDRFLLYLTAFNWSAGPQMVIWLIVLFFVFSGILSREMVAIVNLAALIVILLYHLFIVRNTLKLSFFLSLGLVAGEVMVSQFVEVVRVSLLG